MIIRYRAEWNTNMSQLFYIIVFITCKKKSPKKITVFYSHKVLMNLFLNEIWSNIHPVGKSSYPHRSLTGSSQKGTTHWVDTRN